MTTALRIVAWLFGGTLVVGVFIGAGLALSFPWVRRRIERAGDQQGTGGGVGIPQRHQHDVDRDSRATLRDITSRIGDRRWN